MRKLNLLPKPKKYTGFAPRMTAKEFQEKQKKKPVPHEHLEQVAFFNWVRSNERKYPDLEWMYAVPNGGARHPVEGNKMKLEGVKPGVPDIVLPVARGGFFGAYFENKTPGSKKNNIKAGTVSDPQAKFIDALRVRGYLVKICYGKDELIDATLGYLELPETIVL